jgi:hypothetical protein
MQYYRIISFLLCETPCKTLRHIGMGEELGCEEMESIGTAFGIVIISSRNYKYYNVVCRAKTKQRQRDKQIYQSRF